MEGTFASAKNQYKLNFVQYSLTNEPKYKTAYETAQKTMDDILSRAPERPVDLKPIKERAVVHRLREESPMSIPSQAWKYWTLCPLVILSFVLARF